MENKFFSSLIIASCLSSLSIFLNSQTTYAHCKGGIEIGDDICIGGEAHLHSIPSPPPTSTLDYPHSRENQHRGNIAIFVNGNGDCCAHEMEAVRDFLGTQGFEIVDTPWDKFELEGKERNLGISNDRDFVNQLPSFVNSLPSDVQVILIGHSFGGDSLLSAVPRMNRPILFLGVLDPVAAGGLRAPIRNHYVPDTVNYFFNRWQTTNVWPVENSIPGTNRDSSVRCGATTICDQQEQSNSKNSDGSNIKSTTGDIISEAVKCRFNILACNTNVLKDRQLQHQLVPRDAYIQQQIINRTGKLIAEIRNVPTINATLSSETVVSLENIYFSSNVSEETDKIIKKLLSEGHKLKFIAFTSDGGWSILYDRNRFYNHNIPEEAQQVMTRLAREGRELKSIAFNPDGGWSILYDRNGFYNHNIPEEAQQVMTRLASEGRELKSIAFNAYGNSSIFSNAGWSILYDRNEFLNRNIPEEIQQAMTKLAREGRELKSIAFTPNNGWNILYDRNSFLYRNIPETAQQVMTRLASEGREFKFLSFLRGSSGWAFLAN